MIKTNKKNTTGCFENNTGKNGRNTRNGGTTSAVDTSESLENIEPVPASNYKLPIQEQGEKNGEHTITTFDVLGIMVFIFF